jgi:hypothetical protein
VIARLATRDITFLAKNSVSSGFKEKLRLVVEPDGLTVDRDVMTAKYSWAAFQSVEIARNAVILPLDDGIGLVMPASAYASDTERHDFAAAISKRLEERAPQRNDERAGTMLRSP